MASSIKDVLRSGEGSQIEFKKTLSQLEKVAKTLVSFANTKGGTLLIGVQDDKYVIGFGDAEEEIYMLEQATNFYCQPKVNFSIREEEIYGKQILVVEVAESNEKPHRSLSTTGEWLLYVRSGDQCLIATPLVSKALEMEKTGRAVQKAKILTNNEKELFSFLDARKKITLKDYAKLINVSKRRAYKILIQLTLTGKLFMHDTETSTFFTRA